MPRRLLALALALVLTAGLFAGCKTEPEQPGAGPAQTQTVPAAGTQAPEPDWTALYAEAVAALEALPDRTMTVTVTEERSAGGDLFQESTSRTVRFQGMGTGDPVIHLADSIVSGENRTPWEELWYGGTVWAKLKQTRFRGEQSLEAFLEHEVPAMLPNPRHYGSVVRDGEILRFSDPVAAEPWAMPEGAVLLEAAASAVLTDGAITAADYTLRFSLGSSKFHTIYHADFTPSVDRDLKTLVPADSETLISLESPRSALLLYRAWQALNSSSCASLETSGSVVYGTAKDILHFSDELHNWGRGAKFCYRQSANTSFLLKSSGDPDRSELYAYDIFSEYSLIDGIYLVNQDGRESSENIWDVGWNPERYGNDFLQRVHSFEGQFLPGYNSLSAAVLRDEGAVLRIEFSAGVEYGKRLLQFVSEKLYGDASRLGAASAAFSFGKAEGWLELEKATWQPKELSVSFEGTCTVDGSPLRINMNRLTRFRLYDPDTYAAITGVSLEDVELEDPPTPLFYKVTGANGETLWLLGTIHIGDNRTAALPQVIYDACDSSDALALEIDLFTGAWRMEHDEALLARLDQSSIYDDGSTIAEHIDPELYEAAVRILQEEGRYAEGLDYCKPIVWYSQIISAYREDFRLRETKGVDRRLAYRAKAQRKEILEAESQDAHLLLATEFSDALQEMLLRQIVAETGEQHRAGIEKQYACWCEGDEAALRAMIAELDEADRAALGAKDPAIYEEYHRKLCTDRDAAMLESALDCLHSGKTVFFAVGLAHLLGDTGLVDGLREAGYTVAPVQP